MKTALTIALCLMGTTVQADSHEFYTSRLSVLTASTTDEPGCIMQIDIANYSTDLNSRVMGVLGITGVGVKVVALLNTGPGMGETYIFTPPIGYVARPEVIDVVDGDEDVVYICEETTHLGF